MGITTWAKLIGGFGVWVLIVLLASNFWNKLDVGAAEPAKRIQEHFDENKLYVTIELPPTGKFIIPSPGHLIKVNHKEDGKNFLRAVGEVVSVEDCKNGDRKLTVFIFPHAKHLWRMDTVFEIRGAPNSFDEMFKTLIDEHAKSVVTDQYNKLWKEHGPELEERLRKFADSVLGDVFETIKRDALEALKKREQRVIDIVLSHWESDTKPRVLPLIESKGMPMVDQRVIPLLMNCMQELWDNAPAGSFAWNAFRDKVVPWDSNDNLRKKFSEWLDQKGKSIIAKHMPGVLKELEQILFELGRDADIKQAAGQSLSRLVQNPQLINIVQEIIEQAVFSNEKLLKVVEEKFGSEELKKQMTEIVTIIEPFITDMIDNIVLDPNYKEKRINPKVVEIIRSQVLHKEDFWLVLEPGIGNFIPRNWEYSKNQVRHAFH